MGIKHIIKKPANNKWWPNRLDSDYVVIEDLDGEFGKNVGYYLWKIWGDKYVFEAETKGGIAPISPALIVVTSNYSLEELLQLVGYGLGDTIYVAT